MCKIYHASLFVYGFLSLAVAQSLQHVCARLCVLVRHVLQHASDHWQLARNPAQPGADVVQEAAADHSADFVANVGLLL